MDWERARQPEQKAVRRRAILDAARSLFTESSYDEISLNGIAREAGMNKANVYRYFSSREEIFLTIFEEEHEQFIQLLIARLKRIRAEDPVDAISRAWADASLDRPDWLNLLPQTTISMERNSSVEQMVEFKKVGYGRFAELIEALEAAYPKLDQEQWAFVARCGYAMMAGIWPVANPGETVLETMGHPDVNQEPWDYKSILERGLSALVRGIAAERS